MPTQPDERSQATGLDDEVWAEIATAARRPEGASNSTTSSKGEEEKTEKNITALEEKILHAAGVNKAPGRAFFVPKGNDGDKSDKAEAGPTDKLCSKKAAQKDSSRRTNHLDTRNSTVQSDDEDGDKKGKSFSSGIAAREGMVLEKLVPALNPIGYQDSRRGGLHDIDAGHPIKVDATDGDDATCVSAVTIDIPEPPLYPTAPVSSSLATDGQLGLASTRAAASNGFSEEFNTNQPLSAINWVDQGVSDTVSPSLQRATNLGQPGAYAVGGTGPNAHYETEEGSDSDGSQELEEEEESRNWSSQALGPDIEANVTDDNVLPQPPLVGTDENEGLAVANIVTDDEPQDLPHAEFSEFREVPTERCQPKSRAFRFCCLSLPLLAFLILVAVVVIRSSRTESSDSDLPIASSSPSSSPSLAPISSESYLLSLFPDHTLEAIQDMDSTQSMAYQWMLEDLEYNPALSGERIVQRFSLASLYFATMGEKWMNNENWLDHTIHECRWYNGKDFAMRGFFSRLGFPGYMAEFFPPSEPEPTRCDETTGLFQHLWLDRNNMNGPIPVELYLLTSLKTLSLGLDYNLKGPISSHIGQLTALEGLLINSIMEGGTMPSQIGLLTKLKGLGLWGNDHTGTVPTEMEALSNLQTLIITDNQLSGKIIDVRAFPKIKWFMFHDNNNLSATLPTEIGLLTNLELITAGDTRLHGTIPSQVGLLSNMNMISAYVNQLEGTLPTQLGLLTASTLMSFRENVLSGTIPSQFGLLTRLSVALNFQDNPLLTGTLPTELGLLSNLYYLASSNNNHTGHIPSELGMLQAIREISLANNSLSGTVPETLASLHHFLHRFEIENNPMLSGTMPAPLCNINGTCINHFLLDCIEGSATHLAFTCTDLFCGCNCPCPNSDSNNTLG